MFDTADMFDPTKREMIESAVLERIAQDSLLTWIYDHTMAQSDSARFMEGVCEILGGLSQQGRIIGYREITGTDTLRFPVVSRIQIAETSTMSTSSPANTDATFNGELPPPEFSYLVGRRRKLVKSTDSLDKA